ncbi:pilus assembly protein [Roseburia hominis]
MKKYSAGSITVEAVFCVPLFFYAAICLIWLLEILAIQDAVRSGMQEAGKRMAEKVYEIPVMMPVQLQRDIVASIGAERLDRSLVEGGSSGLDCGKSYMIPGTGILEIKVVYQVRLPIPVFVIEPIKYQETMRIKGWNGYSKAGFMERSDPTVVYITETGIVYHRNYHCTYLEPSVRMVPLDAVEGLRNESQGKYHACERCMRRHGASGMVYITEYGNRYHSTLECSGIKRTVYAVPISEVRGRGACSKCG